MHEVLTATETGLLSRRSLDLSRNDFNYLLTRLTERYELRIALSISSEENDAEEEQINEDASLS